MTPSKVKSTPFVDWNGENDAFYTLIMIDPDAPMSIRPIFAEYRHWMVVNIPGRSVPRGNTLREYVPPAPPRASGGHRIVFAVFKQPHWIRFPERRIPRDSGRLRARFKTNNFANKYKLELIAANLFVIEWDPFVPFIHREIQQPT